MDASTPWRLLEWDSRFFGKRIATLGATHFDRERMDAALAWCRAQAIDCAYLLSQADDARTTRLAQDDGFRVVDLRLTLELAKSTPRETPEVPAAVVIRRSGAADVADLRALASVSHTNSRFYSDGRFDPRLCGELYATWIEKSCASATDVVFVAEHEGRAAGYLSCVRGESARGEIGLVAIAPQARGRGLAPALLEHGLRWFQSEGLAPVSVVTQGNNVRAQRLYQAAGFKTSDVQLWHHRWFDAQGATQR